MEWAKAYIFFLLFIFLYALLMSRTDYCAHKITISVSIAHVVDELLPWCYTYRTATQTRNIHPSWWVCPVSKAGVQYILQDEEDEEEKGRGKGLIEGAAERGGACRIAHPMLFHISPVSVFRGLWCECNSASTANAAERKRIGAAEHTSAGPAGQTPRPGSDPSTFLYCGVFYGRVCVFWLALP